MTMRSKGKVAESSQGSERRLEASQSLAEAGPSRRRRRASTLEGTVRKRPRRVDSSIRRLAARVQEIGGEAEEVRADCHKAVLTATERLHRLSVMAEALISEIRSASALVGEMEDDDDDE